MKKRILISTRNGFTLYGDYYETDDNNPSQDIEEYEKAVYKYRVNNYQLDYWEVQNCE